MPKEVASKLYVVSHMPNPPSANIIRFANRMTQFPNWWHYLDYTWLIVTTDTADQVYEQLKEHLQDTDSILILEIRAPFSYAGWLPKEACEWIRKHSTKLHTAKDIVEKMPVIDDPIISEALEDL